MKITFVQIEYSLNGLFFTILIIVNKNPIISILYLIALFLGVAVYLIILGLSFISLSYLLVYVGAVSIIFLLILILIDIRISELKKLILNNIIIIRYYKINIKEYYNNRIF